VLLTCGRAGSEAARPKPSLARGKPSLAGLLLAETAHGELGGANVALGNHGVIVGSHPAMVCCWNGSGHSDHGQRWGLFGLVVGFIGVGRRRAGKFETAFGRIKCSSALVILLAPSLWAIGSLYSRRARLPSSQLLGAAMEIAPWRVVLDGRRVLGEWKHFAFRSM